MLSMYPPPGIYFRNPFVDSSTSTSQTFGHSHHKFPLDVQSPAGSAQVTFTSTKPLTPPPDMNSVAAQVQPQHSSYYGETPSAVPIKYEHRKYDQPAAYDQSQSHSQSQVQLPKPDVSAARPPSPVYQPHPVHFIDPPNSKRDSHMSAIAPSLQIPRSVNNSQGSIAELAAQVSDFVLPERVSTPLTETRSHASSGSRVLAHWTGLTTLQRRTTCNHWYPRQSLQQDSASG
jgi:hypothetical protein